MEPCVYMINHNFIKPPQWGFSGTINGESDCNIYNDKIVNTNTEDNNIYNKVRTKVTSNFYAKINIILKILKRLCRKVLLKIAIVLYQF